MESESMRRGFPPALVRLKQHLDRRHGSLPKENPGSKWPKTSLGAVKDKCRLDPQQLDSLLRICRLAAKTWGANIGILVCLHNPC
jgi:hypothetical protein